MNDTAKCTAFTAKRTGPTLVAAAALLALALSLLAVVPAGADIELGHFGLTGRHRLADLYDSPGAVCDIALPGPDSLGEAWLRVAPPIVFARDRRPGRDEQIVGWRGSVSALDENSGAWRVVRRSDVMRAVASDDVATYFQGQGWLASFPLAHATYSVTIEMLWYAPDDSSLVEGRALHAIEHYAVVLRANGVATTGRTASVCRPPR
jgi:hypothetical protein